MPGPVGNFDDIIRQLLMQQQQGGMPPDMGGGVPGAMPEQAGMPPEEMGLGGGAPQMAGAADVYSYGNGMGAQAGMPTPQQAQASQADMQQAILLRKALQQMRAGK